MGQRESLPDNITLALYLAWRLGSRGKSQAVIPNAALRKLLAKDKVHKKRMNTFADSLKPVFPHALPAKESYGLKNRLVLCLDENETEYIKDKALSFKKLPEINEIYDTLLKK